ncbi:MAG: hypothetical protein M3304_06945 [Actinomycetota bacterium]|nr:hypothetical protein [Actinomycetota bacterium]
MKTRVLVTVASVAVAGGVFAATAAGNRPERFTEEVAGGQVVCGETTLTATEGIAVGRQHVHRLRSGLYRVIFRETLRGIRATDGDTTYRAVGSLGGNFLTRDPDNDEAIVSGFFHIRINFVGPGGLFGRINFTERLKRNGASVERNRGSCQFADEEG